MIEGIVMVVCTTRIITIVVVIESIARIVPVEV